MAIAIPRSHLRVGIDRIAGLALVASLVVHGGVLYAADRWGNCLCYVGKVVCPKVCDQEKLDLDLSTLPAPPPKPRPRPKPTVVEAPQPKAHTAAPKRGRVVLPDEAFAKPQRPKADTTARLPVLPPEAVVKASEVSAPVLATPLLFDRAGSLSAGPPGEYGLGGTGTSTHPRASGTSPTSTEVAPELPAPKPAPAPPPPPPRPRGPSSPPRVLNWTEPPYPDAARRQGAEGTTVLRITVTADGRPTCIGLAKSSGRDDLDRVAMDHAARLRFAPALQDGERVAMTISFKVKFRLVES
jgi:TonB family protein